MNAKKSLVRFVSLLLTILMLASAAIGCGAGSGKTETSAISTTAAGTATTAANETTGAPAEVEPGWKSDTSPITLDWYVNLSYFTWQWGTSVVSDLITEKTGISINFIAPAGNENEKVNTMIASGNLPDVMTLYWGDPQVKTMEEGGLVYPLNELAGKYDPYFNKVAYPSIVNWFKRDDGNLYGWANFSSPLELMKDGDFVLGNQLVMVRSDMYEAIGKPDMRTPEGFLNALKLAKEKFPQVNGQPMIPLGGHEFTDRGNWGFDEYIQDFLAIPWEKDGKIYDRRSDPEYITWMKTFRKASEMGLIAKDIFIDKNAQIDDKIKQGRYFALIHQSLSMSTLNAVKEANSGAYYTAIDAMYNSKLETPTLKAANVINGWLMSFIPKTNKYPERTIKFFSYLISDEGQKDCALGKEGVTWKTQDGRDRMTPEMVELKNHEIKTFTEKYGLGEFYMFYNPAVNDQWKTPYLEPEKSNLEWTNGKAKSQAIYTNLNPVANTPEGIAYDKIELKWGETLPKLMLAESDEKFDQLFKAFTDFRAAQGYDKIVAIQQANLDKNKKKMSGN